MCGVDPVTAGLVLAGVSTAMGAAGSYQQARGAKNAAMARADAARVAAANEREAGRAEEDRLRIQASQLEGRQRAGLASTGVDIQSGSALDVLTDTDMLLERDAQTIRTNAADRANNLLYQSEAAGAEARSIRPGVSGVASLVGGASQFADRWYRFKGAGGNAGDPNFIGGT